MEKQTVLIIDDERFYVNSVSELLADTYQVESAIDAAEGLRQLLAGEMSPDIILLDIIMPDLDGYEICRQLKSSDVTRHIPVLFLTVMGTIEDEVRGLETGAADYIIKPISPPILKARIQTHLTLSQALHDLSDQNAYLEKVVAERTVALQTEIESRKATEARLHYLSSYDPLTELPNRNLFNEHMQIAIAHSQSTNKINCLLLIDLDAFQKINDNHGHNLGDEVLKIIAQRLRDSINETDMVSRLGGDEFAVILYDMESTTAAQETCRRIIRNISEPIKLDQYELFITASMGLTLIPNKTPNLGDLLKQADLAMYEAKARGKNTFIFFDENMLVAVKSRAAVEQDLHVALREEQFCLYYQPIFNLKDKSLRGAEALIRWQHPTRGLLLPGEFIPVAEETDLIFYIGEWVMRTAVAFAAHCRKLAPHRPLLLSINLSPRQLNQSADWVATLINTVQKYQLEPGALSVEITEGSMMKNTTETIARLNTIKQAGIALAVDDFGVGYSSLSYIQKFPLDYLKIDRSFVNDITRDNNDAMLVRAIIAMAQSLGLKTIAEGVESEAELAYLQGLDCDCVQGFYFAKPMPEDEFVSKYIK